ncbi:class I tRNA ligase family protein, partial [Salmonella sp. s60732]|uniref:class I tRNA ligase family protein n=1 Tax=Salmonella sp. s60732 TaxID=3160132 RepID=UPI00375410B4
GPVSLRFYDTARAEVRPFEPIEPGKAGLYYCGATVQGMPHVGHVRSAIAFDQLTRWLEARGLRVTVVRNVTDIDDKIIARAVQRGITIRALTDEVIAAMHEDIGALRIEP